MIDSITNYLSEYGLLTGAVFLAVLIGVTFIKSMLKRIIQIIILVVALIFIGGYIISNTDSVETEGVEL